MAGFFFCAKYVYKHLLRRPKRLLYSPSPIHPFTPFRNPAVLLFRRLVPRRRPPNLLNQPSLLTMIFYYFLLAAVPLANADRITLYREKSCKGEHYTVEDVGRCIEMKAPSYFDAKSVFVDKLLPVCTAYVFTDLNRQCYATDRYSTTLQIGFHGCKE